MTTENTTTDITVTDKKANWTPEQFAEDFIKTHSVAELVEYMVSQKNENLRYKNSADNWKDNFQTTRGKLQSILDSVETFLKDHISEGNNADLDELKELAEELDIELTKDIKVTFTASVEVEMTVPLDFDLEGIDESNFTVSAEFDGMTDVEVDDTDINVEDFEVEEN